MVIRFCVVFKVCFAGLLVDFDAGVCVFMCALRMCCLILLFALVL